MTDHTATENAALRRVIAEHDRYLTGMMNADPRGADASDYLNASFDLYSRLNEAGFGDLAAQQRMHAAAISDSRDLTTDTSTDVLPAEPLRSA
ncbi:hypothetical protein [Curtobacterium sp. MCSS17_016]|uniref:hypothetical protein n=1 Tax=Curtobacterium sp. MCSS17_016 TaxID=2175644 RepID=UPI000DA841C9|nr:hypothetical protein [Curtobacterium sp. MCSS17_016]WIE81114.1 hypothetical protein DEJ19_021805 [Curtobacterium sp. MCSS17_016]